MEMKYNVQLPVIDYVLDDMNASRESELYRFALVEQGAILSDYVMLSAEDSGEELQFKIQDESRHLLIGAGLIPGMQIKRVNRKYGEHYARFSSELIRTLGDNMMMRYDWNQFKFRHDGTILPAEKIHLSEIWYKEGKEDKSNNFGFNYPEGTQVLSVYVPDDESWNLITKNGLKAFSCEAWLNSIPAEEFKKQNFCPISYKDVIKAKMRKLFYEENMSLQFSGAKDLKLEKFDTNCSCKNCNELKSLDWNLPGVLPDGKKIYETISAS